MFSNLRTNSQLYILHRDTTPYIEIGQVVSVSQPRPRFQTNSYITPQEQVVANPIFLIVLKLKLTG